MTASRFEHCAVDSGVRASAPAASRAGTRLLAACLVGLNFFALAAGAGADETTGANATQQKPLFPVTVTPPFPAGAAAFEEARDLILQNYYSDAIGAPDLYWAAIKGMLRHVSPPDDPERARIWPPEDYERVADTLRGVRNSIGIRSSLNQTDGSLTVSEVLPGSPAEGVLRPLDRIMRVNGNRLLGKSVAEVDALMFGHPGEVVRLTVVRDIEVTEVEVVIRTFESEDLFVETLPGDVLYVQLRRVSNDLATDLAEALAAPDRVANTRLLIDLRGNSGGVFNQGLKLAEIFLPAGRPILHALQHGNRIQTVVSQNAAALAHDLVLLVDGGTASSAEIFAGALQSHRRARLVGAPTFGKATVEKTFTLRNEYRVKFIVGALFRPGGQSWQSTGLQPDLLIEQDAKLAGRLATLPGRERLVQDAQLRAAWQLLR